MDILTTLGINSTLWIQFALFAISYLFLTELVFKPYMKAHHHRETMTVGSEEEAADLSQKTQEMHLQFESSARHINEQIRGIFDRARAEASHQYDELVTKARTEADDLTRSSAEKLKKDLTAARDAVKAEIPRLSASITERLLGSGG